MSAREPRAATSPPGGIDTRFVRQSVRATADTGVLYEELLARPVGIDTPAARLAWIDELERDGRIEDLDTRALEVAFGMMRTPETAGTPAVAVNCSGVTLQGMRWWEVFDGYRCTRERSLCGRHVEITERMVRRARGAVECAVVELRDAGARICIDDIGAPDGHHDLRFVEHLMPDMLKIAGVVLHRAVVTPAHQASRYEAEMRGYVAHAHALGIQVIAEGVEGQEYEALARSVGVDGLQGYWISTPC